MSVPPGFVIWRGQPGSCAHAHEVATRRNPRTPSSNFACRMTGSLSFKSAARAVSFLSFGSLIFRIGISVADSADELLVCAPAAVMDLVLIPLPRRKRDKAQGRDRFSVHFSAFRCCFRVRSRD